LNRGRKDASAATARALLFELWKNTAAIETESDRGVALIAAAFLDDALAALLRCALVDDAKVVE
jgi:hypothetical protein